MIRDAPRAALLTMRIYDLAARTDLILSGPPKRASRRPQKDCATTLAMRLHSTCDDRDRRPFGDDVVELHEQRFERAGRRRGHRYLHLHRFDHHKFIASCEGFF